MTVYHCTLAKKYNPDKHDVLGWWVSEKVDGVRALWCPERKGFFSRSNKPLNVPPSWLDMMADVDVRLDGEFFMGRGRFQQCVSAVRKKAPTEEQFAGVRYVVFDAITEGQFEARMVKAMAYIDGIGDERVYFLKHTRVTDMNLVGVRYTETLALGGEGLMFRNGGVGYEMKRSGHLLKWKDEIDGTAVVTGMDPGQGKHEGRAGALVCVDDETGVVFRVGTGLSDEEREWWQQYLEECGATEQSRIRWRAMERTRDGIPRHPSYQGLYKGE